MLGIFKMILIICFNTAVTAHIVIAYIKSTFVGLNYMNENFNDANKWIVLTFDCLSAFCVCGGEVGRVCMR